MALGALNTTKDNDTASMFRDDALSLGVTAPLSRALFGTDATNDEKFDVSEYDTSTPHVPGKPLKRKLTSDEEALAKKSGYQITDERDINGAQNSGSGSGGGSGSEAKAQAEMLQRAAATNSIISSISNTAKSWYNSAKNFVGDCVDSVTGFVSDAYERVANTFNNYISQPLANAWQSTKETFSEYVSQPLSRAWEGTKSTFSEYVAQPVTNLANRAGEMASSALESTRSTFNEYVAQPVAGAANRVGEVASSAWEGTKSTFSEYVGTPASNLASGASEMASSAWTSTKSFFGYGSDAAPAQEATQQAVARTEATTERPNASAQTLSGEQSNPDAGFSLRSTFGNAIDRASQALGLDNDGPSVSTPTSTPIYTPVMMR